MINETNGENPSYEVLKSVADECGCKLTEVQIMDAGFLLALYVIRNSEELLEKYTLLKSKNI